MTRPSSNVGAGAAQGHTPGKWEYTATVSFHDRPDLPCVVDEFRLVVAQCWDDGHTEEECEANARLIAAAPELLEALEDLLGWRDDSNNLHKPIEVRAAYMRARAAIAKARGVTP